MLAAWRQALPAILTARKTPLRFCLPMQSKLLTWRMIRPAGGRASGQASGTLGEFDGETCQPCGRSPESPGRRRFGRARQRPACRPAAHPRRLDVFHRADDPERDRRRARRRAHNRGAHARRGARAQRGEDRHRERTVGNRPAGTRARGHLRPATGDRRAAFACRRRSHPGDQRQDRRLPVGSHASRHACRRRLGPHVVQHAVLHHSKVPVRFQGDLASRRRRRGARDQSRRIRVAVRTSLPGRGLPDPRAGGRRQRRNQDRAHRALRPAGHLPHDRRSRRRAA